MPDLYQCPRCKQLNTEGDLLDVIVRDEILWMCSCCAEIAQVIEYEPVDPQSQSQGFA